MPLSRTPRAEADLTKGLTEIRASAARADLEAMLEQAGLELWRAPKGFWAIRLKGAGAAAIEPQRRRRRAR